MYKLIKDVIESNNFKKDDMISKIKSCWIRGDITEAEHNELLALLPSHLNYESERPEWIELAERLSERITELEQRIITLEGGTTETPKYEKWEKWDGISNKYQYGAIVEHNGVIYQNILIGQQNTWEPGTPGTESLWRVYTE